MLPEAHQQAVNAANFQSSGDLLNAEFAIKKALALDSNNADYIHFLGLVKFQQHNIIDAIKLISSAIKFNNQNPNFHYNLGVILKSVNQLADALHHQKTALQLMPNNAHYMNEIALIYIELGNYEQANKYLLQALELNSQDAITNSNFSYLLRKQNKPKQSIEYAKKALTLNPSLSSAYMNIGQALVISNQIKEGIFYINKSFEFGPDHLLASQQSLLLYMLYISDYSSEEIFRQHQKFCQKYLKPADIRQKKSITSKDKNKPLNIGFISSDFRLHSVFHFFIALVENYNKNNLTVYCYSGVSKPDTATLKIKNDIDFWRDIHNKNTQKIVEEIQSDQIDILIDLSGHTKGNYLPVFTCRPAPIQVTFLGYPFSTGLDAMDYKITDEFSDPTGQTETIHTEKLLRMNPSFLCYTPGTENYIEDTIPAERNSYVTFGSFNKFSKLSNDILNIWSEILLQKTNARLILKNNQPISDLLQENILSAFALNGVDSDRITLINPTSTSDAHMHQYNSIDICLDTYPYNGTTTTFEALWMGVPVISLAGKDHRSRVGNSILRTLSLDELIATSAEEYANIACALANNLNIIHNYRKSLRKKLKTSALTDGKTYSKKFERLMWEIWERHSDL